VKAEPGVDVTVCPATTLTNRRVITGGAARASTGKNETGGAGVSDSATVTTLTNSRLHDGSTTSNCRNRRIGV
jgi:hypothetical protein